MDVPSKLRQAASRWIKRRAAAIEDNEIERDLRKNNAARPLPTSAQEAWETAIDAIKLARRAVLAGVVAAFTAVLLLWIEAVLLAADGDPGPGASVAVAATISVLVGAALIVGGSYGARTGDLLVQTGGLALVAAAGGASVYYLIW